MHPSANWVQFLVDYGERYLENLIEHLTERDLEYLTDSVFTTPVFFKVIVNGTIKHWRT